MLLWFGILRCNNYKTALNLVAQYRQHSNVILASHFSTSVLDLLYEHPFPLSSELE